MIRVCMGALLSHWKRNPLQLFAYLAGLALATALWSGVQAINSEARASYDAAANTLGEGQYDQLVPRQGDALPQALYVMLRRAGWIVSPVIDASIDGVRLVGIDPLTSPLGLDAFVRSADSESTFQRTDQLWANAQTAARLVELSPVVVDPDIAPGMALGDIGYVQRLLGREDLTRLTVLPDQPLIQTPLEDIAPDLRLQPSQQVADIAQLTDSFHLNLTAFGLLSFAVGLFIVHSTIGLAFEQRRGMIRTMRSLGVPLQQLVVLVSIEMLTLATIGAGLGIVLGYVVAAVLLPDVAATLRGLYGAQVSGRLQLRAEWWLSGFLIALLGAALAISGRIWQVARMPLLASAKPRAWIMAGSQRLYAQLALALSLLTLAGALALVGKGLLPAFALLGCLLIGAALVLPWMADRIVSMLEQWSSGAVARWFWADTRQQLPGLSLALMALLLAVSANIGVVTMVSSFRLTFEGFLEQRLAPELFVQAETVEQSDAVERFAQDNGIEILPLLDTRTDIAGHPARLFGVRVGATYRENWSFIEAIPDVWDSIESGQGAIVNEQFARRFGFWPGTRVEIAPDMFFPVVGVVGDYGNPHGQVIVSERVFRSLHPEVFPDRFGLRTEDVQGLRNQLTGELGISESAMINQGAVKAASLDVFERTFAVTAALNVLTLGVAGFAMLMSLLTLADLRVPQLAPVWALGLTRRFLGRLELMRAVALAIVVFAMAVPLGLALAWVLLSIVNVEAFGWQLPIFYFPFDYAVLGLWSVVAAALAASWPALRLMRSPPSSLLKVFAHER